jgi:hypothetical protein
MLAVEWDFLESMLAKEWETLLAKLLGRQLAVALDYQVCTLVQESEMLSVSR